MAATTAELLTAGTAIDLALAVVLVELCVFAGYRLLRARSLVAGDVHANLVAAAGLLGAAHAALADAWWGMWAGCLLLALAAHVIALRMRWRVRPDAWSGVLRRVV